jgi:histidinol phosphatase-like enzyme
MNSSFENIIESLLQTHKSLEEIELLMETEVPDANLRMQIMDRLRLEFELNQTLGIIKLPQIYLLVGYPAGGKTSISEPFLKQGFTILNRDSLKGSLNDLALKMDSLLEHGVNRIVLDNTYGTKASRELPIQIAKKYHIPITCLWLTTTFEESIFNFCMRMYRKYQKILWPEEIAKISKSDPSIYPPVVFFHYRKTFEEPTSLEGFNNIVPLTFLRKWDDSYQNAAIILDYDGTIRAESESRQILSKSDVQILPNVSETLHAYQKNHILCGNTNQYNASQKIGVKEVEKLIEYTQELIGVKIDTRTCPHSPNPIQCYCRKPMQGYVVEFIEKYKLNPNTTIYIGNETLDKTTAFRAGIEFIDADEFFKRIKKEKIKKIK